MAYDYLLVAGVLVLILSIPAFLNAFSTSSSPRMAMVMMVVGASVVAYVMISRPNTYSFEGLPEVFVRVVASAIC